MPLYEYRCSQCGDKFEKLVRMGAADGDVACPSCGSSLVDRLISLFGRITGAAGDFSSSSGGCTPVGGG